MFNWGGLWPKPQPALQKTNVGGEPLPVSVRSEPIVGYRIWRVKPTPTGTVLYSLNQPYEWKVDNTAECLVNTPQMFAPRPKPHDDPAPSLSCACGFYVSLPEQPLQEWEGIVFGKVHASGTVALTGRVIRCTMGYKAEHAEIQSPVVVGADCAFNKTCAGDVARIELQAQYAAGWCAEHAGARPGAVVEAAAYFRTVIKELSVRYPNIEFLSWI